MEQSVSNPDFISPFADQVCTKLCCFIFLISFKELQMFLHPGPGSADGVGSVVYRQVVFGSEGTIICCHHLNRNSRIDTVSVFGLFLK